MATLTSKHSCLDMAFENFGYKRSLQQLILTTYFGFISSRCICVSQQEHVVHSQTQSKIWQDLFVKEN